MRTAVGRGARCFDGQVAEGQPNVQVAAPLRSLRRRAEVAARRRRHLAEGLPRAGQSHRSPFRTHCRHRPHLALVQRPAAEVPANRQVAVGGSGRVPESDRAGGTRRR